MLWAMPAQTPRRWHAGIPAGAWTAFGALLDRERQARGWTIDHARVTVARRHDLKPVARSVWSDLENGVDREGRPSQRTLAAVEVVMGWQPGSIEDYLSSWNPVTGEGRHPRSVEYSITEVEGPVRVVVVEVDSDATPEQRAAARAAAVDRLRRKHGTGPASSSGDRAVTSESGAFPHFPQTA